jgi:hypothetical protein
MTAQQLSSLLAGVVPESFSGTPFDGEAATLAFLAEAQLAKEQAYVSALEDQLDSAGLAIARKEATRGESP